MTLRYQLSRIIFSCLCFSFYPCLLQAQLRPATTSLETRLIQEIDALKKRYRLVSISFAFFQEGERDLAYTAGYATLRNKVKATPAHIYTVASLTKCITGMAAIDLVHQNYFTLDDSVHKILEGFPQNVTVLDLLNHTSGFLREKENENFLSNSSYKDAVDFLPVKFNLKIHRYTNYNYASLGAVIEKTTARRFSEVMDDYYRSITDENLYFSNHDKSDNSALFAANYVRKGRRVLSHQPVDFGLWEPAAFAQTTAKGLAKFLRYHMTPQFLNFIESQAVTIKKRRLRGGVKLRECYSLGFRLRYVNDKLHYVYHNGFLYGVLGTLYYFPQRRAGFVGLSNMSRYPSKSLGLGGMYKIVERTLDRHFNIELAEFIANNGFEIGLQHYESIRHLGEIKESILKDQAQEYLSRNEDDKADNLTNFIDRFFLVSDASFEQPADFIKTKTANKDSQSVLGSGDEN